MYQHGFELSFTSHLLVFIMWCVFLSLSASKAESADKKADDSSRQDGKANAQTDKQDEEKEADKTGKAEKAEKEKEEKPEKAADSKSEKAEKAEKKADKEKTDKPRQAAASSLSNFSLKSQTIDSDFATSANTAVNQMFAMVNDSDIFQMQGLTIREQIVNEITKFIIMILVVLFLTVGYYAYSDSRDNFTTGTVMVMMMVAGGN